MSTEDALRDVVRRLDRATDALSRALMRAREGTTPKRTQTVHLTERQAMDLVTLLRHSRTALMEDWGTRSRTTSETRHRRGRDA